MPTLLAAQIENLYESVPSFFHRPLQSALYLFSYLSTFLFADTISIMGRRISSRIPGISIMFSGGCGSTI
jgi:hypothetical protein